MVKGLAFREELWEATKGAMQSKGAEPCSDGLRLDGTYSVLPVLRIDQLTAEDGVDLLLQRTLGHRANDLIDGLAILEED